jgi:formylglycine-generating enzyme required for sulfatase activity
MNRPHRSIEIFTMSALDLFVTAMGSFAILMMILYPYYTKTDTKSKATAKAIKESRLLFGVWTTRVRDYEQFVNETNYVGTVEKIRQQNAPSPNGSGPASGSAKDGSAALWRNPGYEQEPDFPVVNVSVSDARAFCAWLTKKEREAGLIGPEHEYRLPTDVEWLAAAGQGDYPWTGAKEEEIPPRAGNYAGLEYDDAVGSSGALGKLKYRDDYEMVAPVGKFTANAYGLFDMGGNVWQWCDEIYRSSLNSPELLREFPYLKSEKSSNGEPLYVVHGGGWRTQGGATMKTTYHESSPGQSFDDTGFRCVLIIHSASK